MQKIIWGTESFSLAKKQHILIIRQWKLYWHTWQRKADPTATVVIFVSVT